MDAERRVIPYGPRPVFIPYHSRSQRWASLVAHRRCGKTVACVNDLLKRALELSRPHGRFAYVAPFLSQAKEVAWEYLKRFALPAMVDKNEQELWVELVNGSRIRIHGADNPDRLRGAYLDGVVLDEYADMRPSVRGEVIRPMLADRGGWATFIGTPKGRNEFFDIHQMAQLSEDWYSSTLRASETGILPASELDDARRDMTPEQYEQEFECSFEAAILGAYYGKEMARAEREGRLPASLDKIEGPTHCAWDFGNGANMAVWAFQVSPAGPLVHDFIQISGFYFEDYLKEVAGRGYFGNDYVPHDAKVPSFETGRTRIETMVGLKRKPILVADHLVEDRINAAKLTLNRTRFNATACAPGLEALRQYRQEWDEKAKVFKKNPFHNWASHPADAYGYLAMAWKEHIEPKQPSSSRPLFKALNEMTMKEYMDLETTRPGMRETL